VISCLTTTDCWIPVGSAFVASMASNERLPIQNFFD